MTYNTGAKHHCDLRDAEPASSKGLLLDVNAAMHGKVVVHVLTVGPWCIRFLARAGRAARDTGGLCHDRPASHPSPPLVHIQQKRFPYVTIISVK